MRVKSQYFDKKILTILLSLLPILFFYLLISAVWMVMVLVLVLLVLLLLPLLQKELKDNLLKLMVKKTELGQFSMISFISKAIRLSI